MKTTISDNIIFRYYLHNLVFSGFGFLDIFNRTRNSCLITIDYYLEKSREHAEYVNGNLVRAVKETGRLSSNRDLVESKIDYDSDKINITSDDRDPVSFIWKTESSGKTRIEVSQDVPAEILLSDTEMTLIKGGSVSSRVIFSEPDLCLYREDYKRGKVILRSSILFDRDFRLKSMSEQDLRTDKETFILCSTTNEGFKVSETTLRSGILKDGKNIRAKHDFYNFD